GRPGGIAVPGSLRGGGGNGCPARPYQAERARLGAVRRAGGRIRRLQLGDRRRLRLCPRRRMDVEGRSAPAGRRLGGVRSGDLRGLLDRLALAALDLARRGAELSRAAAPSLEQELTSRSAELGRASEEAADAVARASFLRACAAVEAQLVHCRTARAARERL